MSRKEKTGDRKAPGRNIKKAARELSAATEAFGRDVGEQAAADAIEAIKRQTASRRLRGCVRIEKAGSA